jgi:hypothetical protein
MKIVFNWSQSFLDSEKYILSADIIKRFNAIHGTTASKLGVFLQYELKNRLYVWLLTHLPTNCIAVIRRIKVIFSR